MTGPEAGARDIPAHVPPELVFDFDYKGGGLGQDDPFGFMIAGCAGRPPVFYTPANGGHWIVQRHADAQHVFNSWEIFSSWPSGIPPRPDTGFKLAPVELDPPVHQEFRRILMPMFAPAAVRQLRSGIELRTTALIDAVAPSGRCDFVAAFAAKLPTGIFLDLVGLPGDELDRFLEWELDAIRGDEAARGEAYANITAYLSRFVDERQVDPQSTAIVDRLLTATKPSGEALSKAEVLGVCLLLYLAGLDTVTNTMAFTWRRLASDHSLRRRLAAEPTLIGDASEEFLRLFAVPNIARHVRADTVVAGVEIKRGDRVLVPTMVANRDETEFKDPGKFDPDRRPRNYLTFGYGIHRCLGLLLAKAELEIALRNWLGRIPDFEVEDQAAPAGVVGATLGVTSLMLAWPGGAGG